MLSATDFEKLILDLEKLDRMRRTSFTKAHYFEAVMHDGLVYCCNCFPGNLNGEGVDPVFAKEEWHFVPACAVCGKRHEYMTISE
jgi:hypothetical protein